MPIELPIMKGRSRSYPKSKKSACGWCGEAITHHQPIAESFCGALLRYTQSDGKKRRDDIFAESADMRAIWRIFWLERDPVTKDTLFGFYLSIIEDVIGGQSCATFCSPKCLRSFLNYCVDKFEEIITKERKALCRKRKCDAAKRTKEGAKKEVSRKQNRL